MNKTCFLFIAFTFLIFNSDLAAQTQTEMNQTAHADFEKADAELNKVYKQLIMVLNKEEKQLLIQAQKDWIKFRDSHCGFEAEEFEGGSMQPLIYSGCLTERTNNRIEDLKASLESRAK
jgi:uncharacterized protein YecT (DUF1311 family)